MDRLTKDQLFLEVAALVAKRSTCSRLQVGCVLTDLHGENIWIGYNGGPRGGRNECRTGEPGACGCVHAEANACIKAPGTVEKIAYLTHAPCVTCAVMLVNARVTALHYFHEYRLRDGLHVFEEAGIPTMQWDPE